MALGALAWQLGSVLSIFVADPPPGPEPPSVDGCTVTVIGLPVPARAHHELEVAGARTQLVGDGLQLRLEFQEIVVRLVGPRYRGELTLHPRACSGGSTHAIVAKPKPARIAFEAPKSTVMRCADAPEILGDQWRLLRDVPAFDVGHGATLRCEFKSPGYRPLQRRLTLLPGDNAIALTFEAL